MVAPLVGAWIEIIITVDQRYMPEVAPLVGAWIEIIVDINDDFDAEVAPLVGAWIEMLSIFPAFVRSLSLLL